MKVTLYTNKNWGQSVECTPGVVDDASLEAFHYGYCHILALALHEATGWPLVGIWYSGDTKDQDSVPGHVAVVHPESGYYVDIYGAYEEDPGDLNITDYARMERDDVMELISWGYKEIDPEAEALAQSMVEPVLNEVRAFLDSAAERV